MIKNIEKQRFGRWKVIDKYGKDKWRGIVWNCICDCGTLGKVVGKSLRSGRSKSCGCWRNEKITKHSLHNSPFYQKWINMNQRCYNPKHIRFNIYGGRGIKILWNSFKEFKNDMYKSYLEHVKEFGKKETQIDRVDNNGHYSKENCRWATFKKQARNRGDNHILTFQNQSLTVAEWAEKIKIPYVTLMCRIWRKWPIEKALTLPTWRGKALKYR